ncbi:MAG: hypothetical protein EAZ55_09660 [Cytophagales bacterium]|nr:MAG: hypothetical protein EAZ55_09660 [Cytophagales bacterium]
MENEEINQDPYGIEELKKRTQIALQMGGEEKIKKQHSLKRLTARERIQKLLDKNSFYEIGLLAHSPLKEVKDKTPADGKICGYGTIDTQMVAISADDATVLAGAGGLVGYEKEYHIHEMARKKGFPSIHLGDGGGARIPDIMGAVGMMSYSLSHITHHQPRARETPLITAILGECYGGPTWKASVSDIVIQVKGTIMAVASPAILEIATTEQSEKDALGGWELHAYKTGLVDLFAKNDQEALSLIKKIFQYLPPNAESTPPNASFFEAPSPFKANKILDIIPTDSKYSYDMHELLQCIFDVGSILELKPYYDGSLITAFARLEGQVVGVLANNPKVNAGAMGAGACEKALHFLITCDSYHIPLIFLHDTPGFYVGKQAEENKMPVRIMNFINALHYSTVPKIALIIRKSYGMAHNNMLGAKMGADFMLAFPKAEISFMAPEVACNVVLGRKLQSSDNPALMKALFLQEMAKMNAPWEAAGNNSIDRIIDPRQTRMELVKALQISFNQKGKMSQRKLATWNKL